MVYFITISESVGGDRGQKHISALKISMLFKNGIFQCVGKIFGMEFQI